MSSHSWEYGSVDHEVSVVSIEVVADCPYMSVGESWDIEVISLYML